MPFRGNLPGHYYDAAKDKYFPVQPNHIAPKGASYSQGAVNAEAQAKQLENETQRRDRRLRSGRISRSSLWTPFLNLSIDSHLGHRGSGWSKLDSRSRYYAAGLSCVTGILDGEEYVDYRPIIGFGVSCSQLYFATCNNTLARQGGPYMVHCGNLSTRGLPFDTSFPVALQQTRGALPTRTTMIGDGLLAISGSESFTIALSGILGLTRTTVLPRPTNARDGRVSTMDTPAHAFSRDMAASLDGSHLALAAVDGLLIYKLGGPQHIVLARKHDFGQEQMTVSFLDNNIVMSGDRSGALNFSDIRSNGHVHRLQHSSAINGIVARNKEQIIVSGLQTVALYDIRYLKGKPKRKHPDNCPKCNSVRKNMRHPAKRHCTFTAFPPTQPLVKYHVPEDHHSHYYTNAGKSLAYMPSVDITVVVSHRSGNTYQKQTDMYGYPRSADRVTLYQASTGRILPSSLSEIVYDTEILQVGAYRMRDGPESILLCTRDRIEEWRVDMPRNGQTEGDDPEIRSTRRSKQQAIGTPIRQENLQYVLMKDRFPPDAEKDMAGLWDAGDRGPA